MLRRLSGLGLLFVSTLVLADEDCRNAKTTLAMNQCLEQQLQQAETTLEQYLTASQQQYQDNTGVVAAITKAQNTWQQYRDAHCNSVYSIWVKGTIRGPLTWRCLIKKTHARTHELWSTYLTFMDNKTSVLPEPKHQP